jgi:6-phosphogluconolactonase
MKITAILFSILSFYTMASGQESIYNLVIGTYTNPGKSDGIYVYSFHVETADFKYKAEAAGIKNPSFLAVTKDLKFLYTVSEVGEGAINAYAFDPSSGRLTFINTVRSGGDGPCYIAVDSKRKFLYAGNYGGGTLSAIPLNADGALREDMQTIIYEGKGIKSNQDKSHVHAAVLSPDDRYLFVPDLGTDRVNIYHVDPSKKQPLTPASPAFVGVDAGNGPRHFTFHPNGKSAYLIQEMTGVVTAYDYANGKLTARQSVTLPAAGTSGSIDASDIHVSPDGKFLYGSLRGDINEIVIYAIDKKGGLKYAGRQSTLGRTPRNFAIDPTGNFLLVGNQRSDEIVIFKRDHKTGLLKDTGKKIPIGAPVCLKFVAVN